MTPAQIKMMTGALQNQGIHRDQRTGRLVRRYATLAEAVAAGATL